MKHFELEAPKIQHLTAQAVWNELTKRWEISMFLMENGSIYSDEYKLMQSTFNAEIQSAENDVLPGAILQCFGFDSSAIFSNYKISNIKRNGESEEF